MINIDIGGKKHERTIKGLWKIMDIQAGSDYIYDINSGKSIPLPNDSVDNWYMSMTLEHIIPTLTVFVLNELYRTLKSGGKIRIIVPDALVAIKWFINDRKKLRQKGLPSKPAHFPSTDMSRLFAWFCTDDRGKKSGHSNAFDKETLNWYMRKAGFRKVKFMSYNKCSDIFKGKDYERYKNYSLYVEAKK